LAIAIAGLAPAAGRGRRRDRQADRLQRRPNAAWRWDAARRRFEPASSSLDGLEALNKKLFE